MPESRFSLPFSCSKGKKGLGIRISSMVLSMCGNLDRLFVFPLTLISLFVVLTAWEEFSVIFPFYCSKHKDLVS